MTTKYNCLKKKEMKQKEFDNMQTFGEHLDVLRKMLFRIVVLSFTIAFGVFFFKKEIFEYLLAPCSPDFVTFDFVNKTLDAFGSEDAIYENQMELIATDLPSQFLTHMSISLYLGMLFASPFILYELFRYISPALYENEKKYSVRIILAAYSLFIIGLLVSYFLLFPISCRFLASYSVSEHVRTMVTLDSYISTFVSLTLLMGLVFQLPVLSFFLAKVNIVDSILMTKYRKHAFVFILLISAVITPPDVMTLILVSFPLYILYELSIAVVKIFHNR